MSNVHVSTQSRPRSLRMRLAFGVSVAALVLASAGSASAAKPAHRGCLGEDLSLLASGGAAFGEFVSGMATTTGGIGAEIQAHLAGQVPDEQIPNSCNE